PAVPDSVESGDNSFNQLVDTPTPPIGVSGVTGMLGPTGITGSVGITMVYPGPFYDVPYINEFTERRLNGILQVFYQDKWWPKDQLDPRVFPPKEGDLSNDGGVNQVFHNGKWEVIGPTQEEIDELRRLVLERATEDEEREL